MAVATIIDISLQAATKAVAVLFCCPFLGQAIGIYNMRYITDLSHQVSIQYIYISFSHLASFIKASSFLK
jgi:hypothetical protein